MELSEFVSTIPTPLPKIIFSSTEGDQISLWVYLIIIDKYIKR